MIKYLIIFLLALLIVFIAALIIKAARFKPPIKIPVSENDGIVYDEVIAANHLAAMIQCKTVSSRDKNNVDKSQFEKFKLLLPTLYPNTFKTVESDFAGETGLIYKWKGKSSDKPSVLMAHYDVVPANSEDWSFDPFCGKIENGIVYGRGTLDTKSTLCAAFEAVEKLISENYVPDNDIYLCFSGSEEIAGEGAYSIVDKLKAKGIKPAITVDEGGAIVRNMFPGVSQPCAVIGIAEKGQMAVKLTAKSTSGHASAPSKSDPVSELSKAVIDLKKHPIKPQLTPVTEQLFQTLGKYSTFPLRIIFGNLKVFSPLLKKVCRSLGNDMNALMRSTYVFTMAHASEASNVLPKEASVTCDVRILSGSTSKDILNHFKKVINNDKIEIHPVFTVEPSPCSRTDTKEWGIICDAVTSTWKDTIVSPYLMMARSDSSVYTRICDNVFRFAAMELTKEERAMIHGIDEQISQKKIAKAAEFYHRLIMKL